MATNEQMMLGFERQRNQIFTELHETQSSVVSFFKRSDKRAQRLEESLRAARNRLAKNLVETRAGKGKYKGRVDSGLGEDRKTGRSSRRSDEKRHWQRQGEGGADDPARATLGVVDSYVRYQALFLGGGEYANVDGDEDKDREESVVAQGILQTLATRARKSGSARVITSETIKARKEAREAAKAAAATSGSEKPTSKSTTGGHGQDEGDSDAEDETEPQVDLDPDRIVESLFNGGRPLTARERAEKARENAARRAVISKMPAPLRALRRALVVSQCVAKWKGLVKRRRLQRDLEMRRSYLTSLEARKAREASDRAKTVARSAVSQYMQRTGTDTSRVFGLKNPTHGPPPAEIDPNVATQSPTDISTSASATATAPHPGHTNHQTGNAQASNSGPHIPPLPLTTDARNLSPNPGANGGHDATGIPNSNPNPNPIPSTNSNTAGRRPMSAFPQLQLRPRTTPRIPRTDVLLSLCCPDPEAIKGWENQRQKEDEMERYRKEREFSRRQGGGIFTSAGEVSEKWAASRKEGVFTESTIRLRVLRQADEIIRTTGRPASSPHYRTRSGGDGSVWDHVPLGRRAKSARGTPRGAGKRSQSARGSRNGPNGSVNGSNNYPNGGAGGLPPRPPTGRPSSRPGSRNNTYATASGHTQAAESPRRAASAPRNRPQTADQKPVRFARATTPRGRTPW